MEYLFVEDQTRHLVSTSSMNTMFPSLSWHLKDLLASVHKHLDLCAIAFDGYGHRYPCEICVRPCARGDQSSAVGVVVLVARPTLTTHQGCTACKNWASTRTAAVVATSELRAKVALVSSSHRSVCASASQRREYRTCQNRSVTPRCCVDVDRVSVRAARAAQQSQPRALAQVDVRPRIA